MLKIIKNYVAGTIVILGALLFLSGCAGSKVGSAGKGEELNMKITEERDIVNFYALKEQPTLSLAARGSNKARGLNIASLAGNAIGLATDAIKKVIDNEKKKYIADYQFAKTDLYFYDQLSNEGPFDPVGMQFAGFRIARTFVNKEGITDTAFTASFSVDTTNAYEILNNSIFRLRLDEYNLKYAKAKVPATNENKLNMDIEITIHSTYVNAEGILFDNVTLGKFYLFIRSAPLNPSVENYAAYYNGLKGQKLSGRSFIVPRSFGYHIEDGRPMQGYSQGAYNIDVKVKESSKDSFITKVISENSDLIIDVGRKQAIKYVNKSLSGK